MKLHAKAGKRTARVLSIALSVMLIVTLIPIREIGRVYAEPNDDTQGAPAFSQQVKVDEDGVIIAVEAPEGVFPADATLEVSKITDEKDLAKAGEAVAEQREQGAEPDRSYVFDIKVLDSDNNEIQLTGEQGQVTASFSKAGNEKTVAGVYQLLDTESSAGENEETPAEHKWKAEKRDVSWNSSTNMFEVQTDSFAPFVVEFFHESSKETKDAEDTQLLGINGAGDSDTFSQFWNEGEERYVLSDGIYKMTGDFTAQGYLYVPSGVTVTIDLTGHTLKRDLSSPVAKGYVIENDGTLTIQDSSGNNSGMITGGKNGGKSMSDSDAGFQLKEQSQRGEYIYLDSVLIVLPGHFLDSLFLFHAIYPFFGTFFRWWSEQMLSANLHSGVWIGLNDFEIHRIIQNLIHNGD